MPVNSFLEVLSLMKKCNCDIILRQYKNLIKHFEISHFTHAKLLTHGDVLFASIIIVNEIIIYGGNLYVPWE